MRILLGCGDEYREGWVHVDQVPLEHVDVVHDLNVYPWPFDCGTAERIEAIDVLEHLRNVVRFMNECWRILKPGGRLLVQAVGWQSENLWRDPTHLRGFHPDTLRYFDPDSEWHRFGKLYTTRTWRVLSVAEENGNVITELEPRK
jgi:SAM-dependent methyltransferase